MLSTKPFELALLPQLADVFWVAAYLPYHWHNATEGHLANETWCLAVTYLASACIVLNSTAGVVLAVLQLLSSSTTHCI
jgi:hypothetical protein